MPTVACRQFARALLACALMTTAALAAPAGEPAPAQMRLRIEPAWRADTSPGGTLDVRLRRAVEQVCTEAARTMVVGRQEYLADCRVGALVDARRQLSERREMATRGR